MSGIKDWTEKKAAMAKILGMSSFRRLLEFSAKGSSDYERKERLSKLDDAQKKWIQSRPSETYHPIIAGWCEDIFGDSDGEAIEFFIDSPAAQFAERAAKKKSLITPAWFEAQNTSFQINRQITKVSIADSLDRRRLDQRLFYMNADSAELWKATINANGYPVYRWCCDSLEQLMGSEDWINVWGEAGFEQLVSLGGGGAPNKDRLILEAIADNKLFYRDKLSFVHLDISMMMIKHSINELREWAPNSPALRRLDIEFRPIVADINRLSLVEDLLYTNGRTAWFLLGGTIGNMKERAFFESLNQVSRSGDTLVLGIDTIDEGGSPDVAMAMRNKYMDSETQKFAIAPLARALEQRDPHFSRKTLTDSARVDVVKGSALGYSDVAETLTVEMSVDVSGRKFRLFTSNRYALEIMITFCEAQDWKLLRVFSPTSGKKASFHNLLLQKK